MIGVTAILCSYSTKYNAQHDEIKYYKIQKYFIDVFIGVAQMERRDLNCEGSGFGALCLCTYSI